MTLCNSPSCTNAITPEDAVYDDRASEYYCDMDCFNDWADANYDEVTEFYVTMNVTK